MPGVRRPSRKARLQRKPGRLRESARFAWGTAIAVQGSISSCVPSPNIPVREPAPHRHAAHSWPATRAASRAPAMRPLRETVVAISPDNCMIHPHCVMRLSHPVQPFAPFEQQRAEPSGSALHPMIPDHRGGVAHLVFATAENSTDSLTVAEPPLDRRAADPTSSRSQTPAVPQDE